MSQRSRSEAVVIRASGLKIQSLYWQKSFSLRLKEVGFMFSAMTFGSVFRYSSKTAEVSSSWLSRSSVNQSSAQFRNSWVIAVFRFLRSMAFIEGWMRSRYFFHTTMQSSMKL